jgi:hypothetical protein
VLHEILLPIVHLLFRFLLLNHKFTCYKK